MHDLSLNMQQALAFRGLPTPDYSGSGSPEGVVTAPEGSLYHDTAANTYYRKDTGSDEFGWEPTSIDIVRQPVLLYEIYPNDYYPPAGGTFDPAEAVALFSEVGITWLGNEYARRVLSRSSISHFISSQFNSVSVTYANPDNYMSLFVIDHDLEGLRLVIRYIDRALSTTLEDSLVVYSGRLQPCEAVDEQECVIPSKQELASVVHEIPRRTFSRDDPLGRSPNDPLFEGFRFQPRFGTTYYTVTVTRRFLLFFTRHSTEQRSLQWSSEDNINEGDSLPYIFGRCQMEGIPIVWEDEGTVIVGIWVFAGHKVTDITDIQVQTVGFQWLAQGLPRLGDPGGTGTNNNPDDRFGGLFSRTAYIDVAVSGSSPDTVDSAPTITAIVLGEVDLPASTGTFTEKGFSDNPSYIARKVLTDPDMLNLNPALVDDTECFNTALICNLPIKDQTNGELLALTSDQNDLMQQGAFTRYRSTSVLNTKFYSYQINNFPNPYEDPLPGPDFPPIDDPGDTPPLIAPVTFYRKAYTYNAPLTDKMRAVDFLYKKLFPTARLFLTIGPDGRHRIKAERPADSSYLRADAAVTDTTITIEDVDPWLGLTPFVERVYLAVLARSPDSTELADALDLIQLASGVSVSGAIDFVRGLFDSAEYAARSRTNSEFVYDLYAGFMDRLPDPGGYDFWLAQTIANGRSAVLDGFPGLEFTVRVSRAGRATKGFALIGAGLITADLKKVSGAVYSTDGNAIPISATASGTLTLTASGATLSGGTDYVAPSATLTIGGAAQTDAQLVATIDGVEVAYTLNPGDSLDTAAAMLATAINAEWSLKPYLKAVWDVVDPLVVRVQSKLGTLLLESALENNHEHLLASPTDAPTGTAAGSGTLAAGVYDLAYSYQAATGETYISPRAQFTLSANQKINVDELDLPTGAASVNWYFSKAHDDTDLAYLENNSGAPFTINALPLPESPTPPIVNTAGEEVIRVMAAFTAENVRKGQFRWPLATRSDAINQVLIKYREAKDSFAQHELYVNDYLHQRRVGKVNKVEIDGSGIDNYSQASRVANVRLAKEREGNFFCEWSTDEAGLALELGDVVCVTDYTGLLRQPVRIETLEIQENLDVQFTARIYSSVMLSERAGRRHIAISTPLRYFSRPRPISDWLIAVDANLNRLIQFDDHPRPNEIPAEDAVEVWVSEDRDDPENNLKHTYPVTTGTSHMVLLYVIDSDQV